MCKKELLPAQNLLVNVPIKHHESISLWESMTGIHLHTTAYRNYLNRNCCLTRSMSVNWMRFKKRPKVSENRWPTSMKAETHLKRVGCVSVFWLAGFWQYDHFTVRKGINSDGPEIVMIVVCNVMSCNKLLSQITEKSLLLPFSYKTLHFLLYCYPFINETMNNI